jgi:phosphoglycerate dehydrogenase-like enzyme
MNILLHRNLPAGALEVLRRIAPNAEFRHEVNGAAIAPHLDWAEVVFGNPEPASLRNRPNLRWLQIVSSGFDDYASLAGQPVVVTTAHGVHAASITQQVLMAMLMFARGQLHFGECQRNRKWDRNPAVPFRLEGQTLGLVGYGSIGQELARFAPLLRLRPIAVKRTPAPCPPELAQLGELANLDALLEESVLVVVCVALTALCRYLVVARRLDLM